MKLAPYLQALCNICEKPVGFVGQPIAYSSLDCGWECPKHINRKWKRKIDSASLVLQRSDNKKWKHTVV